jgi:hypothetical protein
VLTNHARKPLGQWETNTGELDTARRISESAAVRAAVAIRFPDDPCGAKPH